MKNELGSTGNRADHMQEQIAKFEDENLDTTQVEETELRVFKRERTLWRTITFH